MDPLLHLGVEGALLDPLDLLDAHLVDAKGGEGLHDGVTANGDVHLAQLLAAPGANHVAGDLCEVGNEVGAEEVGEEVVGGEGSPANSSSAAAAAAGVLEIGTVGVGSDLEEEMEALPNDWTRVVSFSIGASSKLTFDLYFRKNPFGGEYTVFAGLEECIHFIANFKLKDEDITFLKSVMPTIHEEGFFDYLKEIDCSDVEVYAIPEGSVVFPKVPLMRVEGPVAGPDGGISASKYTYIGGFDATSNVAAGKLFGIPLRGTHSHAFVSSYMSIDEILDKALKSHDGSRVCEDFVSLVQTWLSRIQVMRSGLPNFCAVALALNSLGYKPSGIRLDSGDLAYQSNEARKFFRAIETEFGIAGFGEMAITASNDLNEETIDALNKQGHEVDAYGIGTYLVTCYAQAALGCVFKLVEINNQPRIKLSEDIAKVSIPCKKRCFRLYGKEGYPLVDIISGESEPPPKVSAFSVVTPLMNLRGHMSFLSVNQEKNYHR
ncbi:Nicotinate phosphoribosyltransferase 2 [Ananas comosus]|uniref:nicotinate phosphoribosyltransferase n=1 Tax=Ananas comosus TaxID=4615 RepID=A0A199W5D4_ANACO|nr:Nicotinate phosphoribosyltransferase 2 [Ananas comosus]